MVTHEVNAEAAVRESLPVVWLNVQILAPSGAVQSGPAWVKVSAGKLVMAARA